jgi:Icc-related predicted phosphoesterase
MRLLIFSDIHNDLKALQRLMDIDADRYIAAGDLSNFGKNMDAIGEIMKPKAGDVYVIPGNHETETEIDTFCSGFGFHNFHGRSFQSGDVTVAALGYSNPTPFNTPGEYSEEQLAERLRPFAGAKPLVLICHCPPKDTPLDGLKPGAHFGSTAIREFIDKHQPLRFFSGHIHECQGKEAALGQTIGRNPGKQGYLLDLATLKL